MTEQEKNIKIVKAAFEAFNRRDLKSVLDRLAENVEWRCPVTNDFSGTLSWGKPRHTRKEVETFFREVLRDVTPVELKPLRFTAQNDRVIVEGVDHSKATATGVEYLVNWVCVFTLRDGQITVMHDYFDSADIAGALEGRITKAA